MPVQSTAAPSDCLGKRERLKELVGRLGSDATPAMIREHAYREGFGAVNAAMLIFVRNELWPDRKKRGPGGPKGAHATKASAPRLTAVPTQCPNCLSLMTRVKSVYRRQGTRRPRTGGELMPGSIHRARVCLNCGERYRTVDPLGSMGVNTRRLAHLHATEKSCSRCKRIRPIECFGNKASDTDLYRSWCNDCINQSRRESYGNRSIRHLYGLTPEQYQTMIAWQDGKCLICGQAEMGRRGERKFPLSIDHCHTSGKVRGLLCNKCNLGIGNFNDDPERMQAATDYLRRHESAGSPT